MDVSYEQRRYLFKLGANEPNDLFIHEWYPQTSTRPPLTHEQARESREWRESAERIAARAVRDPRLGREIDIIFNSNVMEKAHLSKVHHRAHKAFTALEAYRQRGSVSPPAMDVDSCGDELKKLVVRIQQGHNGEQHNRLRDTPLEIKSFAVETLVYILEEVASRNYNCLANVRWHRPRNNNGFFDNNLFCDLIGEEVAGDFVLNPLEAYPATAFPQHCRDRLYNVYNKIGGFFRDGHSHDYEALGSWLRAFRELRRSKPILVAEEYE